MLSIQGTTEQAVTEQLEFRDSLVPIAYNYIFTNFSKLCHEKSFTRMQRIH